MTITKKNLITFCLLGIWSIAFLLRMYFPKLELVIYWLFGIVDIVGYFCVVLIIKIALQKTDRKDILIWLFCGAVVLAIAQPYWYFFNSMLSNHLNLLEHMWLQTIILIAWGGAHGIFALKLIQDYIITGRNKRGVAILSILINFLIIFLYVSLHSTNFSTNNIWSFAISINGLIPFLIKVFLFNTSLITLFYANKNGISLYSLGILILCSNYTMTAYANLLYKGFQIDIIADSLWSLGLIVCLLGVINILYDEDFIPQKWFRQDNSTRNSLIIFGLIGYTSISLLFILIARAYHPSYFILPVFYLLFLPLVAYVLAKASTFLEKDVAKIMDNINKMLDGNSLLTKVPLEKFAMNEFSVLQDFINKSFEYKNKITELQIQLEQEKLAVAANEQEKFRKYIGQLVHDMKSPIEVMNYFVTLKPKNISEEIRVNAKMSLKRLSSLAYNLLSKYKNQDVDTNKKMITLIIPIIKQILDEKELEYQQAQFTIKLDIQDDCYFKCIEINPQMFTRMVSNLINNAIDSIKDKLGSVISIKVRASEEFLILFFEDNGCGMPKDIQEKFKHGLSASRGKESGSGIGLTQIYDAIVSVNGDFTVYAKENVKTEIVIRLPLAKSPEWLAQKIAIYENSVVLILDDDTLIHSTWNKKLQPIIEQNKSIKIKQFINPNDLIDYVNSLSSEDKKNCILLTDYEIIQSKLTGIDVINLVKIRNSIIITNYADEDSILEYVMLHGLKLLPKYLLKHVPVYVKPFLAPHTKIVDLVWLEDQQFYANMIIEELFTGFTIDLYSDPSTFMNNIDQYSYDTKIILDMYYEMENGTLHNKTGIELIKELQKLGYRHIILLTAEHPDFSLDDSVQIILKSDKSSIHKILVP